MSELPTGWVSAQLGDLVTHIVGGGTPSKANSSYFQGTIPFMTVKDMHSRFIADTQDHITQEALGDSASTMIPADTLIVASRMSLGKIARPKQATAINQDLKALFLHQGIDKTYVEYAWRANESRIQAMGTGTTVKGIRLEDIRSLQVPLAPSAEQTRIADQLDTLLARINACQNRLDAVPSLLKRFRQAVLDAATTGALTKEWREHNRAPRWKLVVLADIAEVVGGVTKDSKRQSAADEEVPYLRVANVQRGYLDLREIKTIRVPAAKLEKLLLEPGDVLFNEGGDLDKLGRGWVWDGQLNRCTFQNHVFRARLKDPKNQAKFVSWWGNSRGLDYFVRAGKQTTNLASINKRTLEALPISLPSPEEQKEIVRRVDALLDLAARIEAHFESARIHAQRLGPQVLAKAFRGELVPQDPSDEPASVFLGKLKTGRATAEATPARKRSKATQEQSKMGNVDQNYIKTVILKIGTDRFSFDELRAHTAGDYESLKAALFALLEEPNPLVRQVFDEDAKAMRLVRVKP